MISNTMGEPINHLDSIKQVIKILSNFIQLLKKEDTVHEAVDLASKFRNLQMLFHYGINCNDELLDKHLGGLIYTIFEANGNIINIDSSIKILDILCNDRVDTCLETITSPIWEKLVDLHFYVHLTYYTKNNASS